ncbi:hypothetical protein DIS24_g4049 [Lasiodiplodia hormozganensis]|uniref:Uncharacterized protein n=1 Tax=Lasiodiplodia hormozganensis TaxID=869390 RepID=A0AA40D1C2_9PEZI|nr:hypothetical protein DIS24_g4049 [Lasiodiplodia hormozganensis]
MACPIHDSSESNVQQFPSDASVECSQQDSEQRPQCLSRATTTDNAAEQNPNAVHCHGCEATGHDAEVDSPEACRAFDDDSTSTNAADLDTPDSSSDERCEIFCPSSRSSAFHFSDESTTSDDGSTTGASSGYASDAVHERFLACDGPWSTYNRRLEMPAYEYDHHQLRPAICDYDYDHEHATSCAEQAYTPF